MLNDGRPASKERDCVLPLYFYFSQLNMQRMQPVLGRGIGCVCVFVEGEGDVTGGYVLTSFPNRS